MMSWPGILLLCLLALALSADSEPWPYNLPTKSSIATCHKQKRNINARPPNFCSAAAHTCSFNISTPEACCERCRTYVPQPPGGYGGHFCNVWTWCSGAISA